MTDTRAAAYRDAAERKALLHELVLGTLATQTLTADEIADQIGEDKLSVRPRLTELKQQGKVVKTPLRRLNASGKKAIVWMAA